MRRIPLRALVFGLVGIALLGALLLWAAAQPWAANQFGYALAGPERLPDHITFEGLRYANLSRCSDASSCRPSQADLQAKNLWPLKQIATIPTLFGQSHPVYALAHDPAEVGSADYTPLDLYVLASGGRYFLYERGGGP